MPKNVTTVGFDADDTLWHNEKFFQLTQKRFADILAEFADPEDLDARLQASKHRNLGRYGFGIKGFLLSMIAAGGGVFVPQPLAWGFEHADPPENKARFAEFSDLSAVPEFVLRLK